jgi:hypothetical protein
MKSDPLLQAGRDLHREPSAGRAGTFSMFPQRVGARMLHELRSALPPTIFFFVGFNFIVLTTNLLVANYAAAVSNFMLATLAALVVGKAVLTANALPVITRFDRAPLLQPILFKTAVYWVAVFLARLAERFVHFSVVDGHRPGDFAAYLLSSFSWQRFTAISLWILVLFLIYTYCISRRNLCGGRHLRVR